MIKKLLLLHISVAGIAAFTLQFLQVKKQKQMACFSCCLYVTVFAIETAKIDKNILDKKAFDAAIPAAGAVASALQFLLLKKQK